jgi:hypothetical protein
MSATISLALDSLTPRQLGEKGHVEYGWSTHIREQILQFFFQITRTDEKGVFRLKNTLRTILFTLKYTIDVHSSSSLDAKYYLSLLYKLIGHTRDIIDGKGEYTLAYMMIHTWYEFYPSLATHALTCMVHIEDKIHPYGSWKDIKYFCHYCKEQGEPITHPLIHYAITLINEQIQTDYEKVFFQLNSHEITLAAKWAPREKSSFGWLYPSLAIHYCTPYLETAYTKDAQQRAILKCKTEYRKVLSFLNKTLDTLQIKQCQHEWSSIDFHKVTSISMNKQKKAFLNMKKEGTVKYPYYLDRILCASYFNSYIQDTLAGDTNIQGKRLQMNDFTKEALRLIQIPSPIERELLNSQWRDHATQTKTLGKMIAMVDVSASMEGESLHAAIALGLRIAEKSVLGRRVMTFSSTPSWINLESSTDFVSQVQMVKEAEGGMKADFYAALDMILDAMIQNKMQPEDVQDLVLVVLSTMQIETGDKYDPQTLYEKIKTQYETAGVRIHGKPYKPPHILFWNLKSTHGFPSLSTQPNCSMMSGYSPPLLNVFCEKGVEAIQSSTPWTLLERILKNPRYKIMETYISSLLP